MMEVSKSQLTKDFVERFLRWSLRGVAVYSGYTVVTALAKNPCKSGLQQLPGQLFTAATVRSAACLGLYPSVYHLAVNMLRKYRGVHDGWNYGLAGAVAGASIILESETRRMFLALFSSARALGAGVAILTDRGVLPSVMYSEVLAFCLLTSYIVYCVCCRPGLLGNNYYRSLLKLPHGYTEDAMARWFRIPRDHCVTCQEAGMHKGSCIRDVFCGFLSSLPEFVKLYLPVHLAPVLVFRRSLVIQRPLVVLSSLCRDVIKSVLFLSTSLALVKSSFCLQCNLLRMSPPLPGFLPAAVGFLCGLGVLFERKSRRQELVLFLVPHVLYALYNRELSAKVKVFPSVPLGFVVTFCLSMSVLMYSYECQPKSLTPMIKRLIAFFVGIRK